MKFTEFDQGNIYLIDSYEPGCVHVNGKEYRGGLALSAETLAPDWGPATIDELGDGHIQALLTLNPQVIIIGTGQRQRFPSAEVHAALHGHGIGVEIMDTGAACRTYNILAHEGRRVVLGLIAGR